MCENASMCNADMKYGTFCVPRLIEYIHEYPVLFPIFTKKSTMLVYEISFGISTKYVLHHFPMAKKRLGLRNSAPCRRRRLAKCLRVFIRWMKASLLESLGGENIPLYEVYPV